LGKETGRLMSRPENQIIVIFGGRGDLAIRKIVPALYALDKQGLMPEKYAILATGRSKLDNDKYRAEVISAISGGKDGTGKDSAVRFAGSFHYVSVDPALPGDFSLLSETMQRLRNEHGISSNTLYYLSLPPEIYDDISGNLAQGGLNRQDDGWKRLIIEKPFGYDYKSAVELNRILLSSWEESQLYRIDHYLGKETVQNILVTRFSNGIFEPLMEP
jgi:glucose-6-phosphate 1-dehydrogenase